MGGVGGQVVGRRWSSICADRSMGVAGYLSSRELLKFLSFVCTAKFYGSCELPLAKYLSRLAPHEATLVIVPE